MRLLLVAALLALLAAPAAGASAPTERDRAEARRLVTVADAGYRQFGRTIELGQAAFDARIVQCPAWRADPFLEGLLVGIYTELSWASISPRLVAPLSALSRELRKLRPRDPALRAGLAAFLRDRARELARYRQAPRTDVCGALARWARTDYSQDFDVLAATGFPRALYRRISAPPPLPSRDVRALNALHARLLALGVSPAVASTFKP